MKKLTWVFALTALLSAGCGGFRPNLIGESTILWPRPVLYGLSLPYPLWLPEFTADSAVTVSQVEKLIPLRLLIDAEGRVTGQEAQTTSDSACAAYYREYLSAVRFEPGLKDGRPAPMELRTLLQMGAVGSRPHLRFPVEPNRAIVLPDLYSETLALNGVQTASMVSFPSYYYDAQEGEGWRRYPFDIFKVELDSSGDVTAAEVVRTTMPRFTDHIRSAIHWGEYMPLRIDGQARASANYLVVSLYPTVSYPTTSIDRSAGGPATLWDTWRVRLVPDTSGLLAGPIPKQDWSGRIKEAFFSGFTDSLVSGRIAVDSAGAGRITGITTDFWKSRRVFNVKSHELRFFPAVGFDGTAYSFEGLIYLKYLDESNIRIWFNWIPFAPSNSVPQAEADQGVGR